MHLPLKIRFGVALRLQAQCRMACCRLQVPFYLRSIKRSVIIIRCSMLDVRCSTFNLFTISASCSFTRCLVSEQNRSLQPDPSPVEISEPSPCFQTLIPSLPCRLDQCRSHGPQIFTQSSIKIGSSGIYWKKRPASISPVKKARHHPVNIRKFD